MAGGKILLLLLQIVLIHEVGCYKGLLNLEDDGVPFPAADVETSNYCEEVVISPNDLCNLWRTGNQTSAIFTTLKLENNSPLWDTYVKDLAGRTPLNYTRDGILRYFLNKATEPPQKEGGQEETSSKVLKLLCFLVYPAMIGGSKCGSNENHHGKFISAHTIS